MPLQLPKTVYFGAFTVTPQVFHSTRYSYALVNLKPLLPGHVLVCPHRRVARVSQLSADEVADLFLTVQRVGRMVERVYKASSLNIAIQDGKDAGQSVEHVHCHIIPRLQHDLDSKGGSDAIYDMMSGEDGDLAAHQRAAETSAEQAPARRGDADRSQFAKPDADRLPRSAEEMQQEAQWLAQEMYKEANVLD